MPTFPITGMVNKHGAKVRLTFKLELDQVWIETSGMHTVHSHFTNFCLCFYCMVLDLERTDKIRMEDIHNVFYELIENHEEYSIMVG